MRRLALGLALALTGGQAGLAVAQADSAQRRPFSFVVLGHIRGERDHSLNPKLGELLERVRALRPDFVLLTGDIIWGDLFGGQPEEAVAENPDTGVVRREWELVDSALATLQVPVYRVPGNHDISDLGTKQVWWRRYGALPRTLRRFGSRFLLLGSPWIPADGDTVRQIVTRPAGLDSAQAAWLRTQLAAPEGDHTFVVLHHLLWWAPDAWWWKEIHPLLRPAGVRIVFGGDYGPLKFSQVTRDSVQYVQSSMEGLGPPPDPQVGERARILSAQFDNFLFVRVDGPAVDLQVKTLGEFSSPQFQPAFYQAMLNRPQPSWWRSVRSVLATKRGLLALGGLSFALFLAGVLVGRSGGIRRGVSGPGGRSVPP